MAEHAVESWGFAASVGESSMSNVPAEVLQTAAMALKLSAEKQNVYVSLNRATLIVRPTLEAVWPMLGERGESPLTA